MWKNALDIPLSGNAIISKERAFSGFLIAFLKIAWILQFFAKKYEYANLIISEIIDCEIGGYLNV